MLAVVWSLSLIMFIFADYLSFPAFYSPLAMMICYAVFLLNPFQVKKKFKNLKSLKFPTNTKTKLTSSSRPQVQVKVRVEFKTNNLKGVSKDEYLGGPQRKR